jgi:hypothetical protein
MTMTDLLRAEARRALHRRAVWLLVAIAVVGAVVFGLIAFFDSAGRSPAQLRANGGHPALMQDWWSGDDSVLLVAAIPLFIGGLLGGATVAGGEWRANTVATVLSWEPRRLRLHVARATTSFVLAVLIAFVLEVLFLGAAVPAVLTHGSTAGPDAGWWVALAAAMGRIALLTGGTALLGVSLATIGRSTAFGLGAVFAWMAIGENLVRGLKPALQRFLVGENVAAVTTWSSLRDASFDRPSTLAAATLVLYVGVVAVVAAATFVRRDVASSG